MHKYRTSSSQLSVLLQWHYAETMQALIEFQVAVWTYFSTELQLKLKLVFDVEYMITHMITDTVKWCHHLISVLQIQHSASQ